MFDLIKKRQPRFSIRNGGHSDIDFALSLIVDGAKNGHYGLDMPIEVVEASQRGLIVHAIANRAVNFDDGNGGPIGEYGPYFFIFESRGEPIGFGITMTDLLDVNQSTEILMASIKPEFRGQGYGKEFMSILVENFIQKVPLKARCYKASTVMKSILIDLGFQTREVTSKGTTHLYLPQLSNK